MWGGAAVKSNSHCALMDRSPNVAERELIGERHQIMQLPIDTWIARATSCRFALSRTRLTAFQSAAGWLEQPEPDY
jgi:hypothetical protein